jgi:autotransporter strand-loop-strand O-heptosyltransferase
MIINQITPGIIPIPPNGWGAVEKIIWVYKQELEKLGHKVNIPYLNSALSDNPDIVHIHMANLAVEAYNNNIPYIFSLHDHHVVHYGKGSYNYNINLEAIKKSVVSFCHAEYLVDYFDETDKLFFLSHGVDTNFFKPNKELDSKDFKLLCIANNGLAGDSTIDRKGFRYAIEAAKYLNLPITVAGPENNLSFFEGHKDLLEYDKLTLITNNPNEEELLKLYQTHSIFLHPSYLEAGHPNLTLLESLSSGLPVVGTYSGSQKLPGLYKIEPNTESVINGITEVINNYDFYKKSSLKIRETHDWSVICERLFNIYKTVINITKDYNSEETKEKYLNLFNSTEKNNTELFKLDNIDFIQHFVKNPFFEIKGNSNKNFKIDFFDGLGSLIYTNTVKSNTWVKLNRQYLTEWKTVVTCDGNVVYENNFNLNNKKVFITFESKSIGDTIAWFPYVEEFRKKWNCKLVVSTFWNKFFKKIYKDIEYVEPGSTVHNLYAMYSIGWFYNNEMEPELPSVIPLQKTITNILGLEFKEIKPNIYYRIDINPYSKKYITICTESTAQLKYWNNPTGWQELVDYLIGLGYDVVNVSKNTTDLNGVKDIKDTSIENTMNVIHHSEFFIGLSSGLSWLSWAINKHVVMISNFTNDDHEFTTNCTRISNHNVCNGCWNNPKFKFDKGDWNWCPEHKDTPRHFECHKSITSKMVIDKIQHLLK